MSERMTSSGGGSGCAGRQGELQVLQDKLLRKQRDLDAIQVLLRVIPWEKLTEVEEELLWGYFVRRDG